MIPYIITKRFLRKGMEIDEELYMEQSRGHRLRLVALMLTRDTFGARWKKFSHILTNVSEEFRFQYSV